MRDADERKSIMRKSPWPTVRYREEVVEHESLNASIGGPHDELMWKGKGISWVPHFSSQRLGNTGCDREHEREKITRRNEAKIDMKEKLKEKRLRGNEKKNRIHFGKRREAILVKICNGDPYAKSERREA